MAGTALALMETLADFGIDLEVIEARSVRPLDMTTIINSVQRTGTLVVADTAWKTGGIAGEVVAAVTESAFSSLKRAPLRVALPDLPVPTSPHLIRDYYPDALYLARVIAVHLGQTIPDAELVSRLSRATPHDVPQREFRGPF